MNKKYNLLIISLLAIVFACHRTLTYTPIAEKYDAGFKYDRFENDIQACEKRDAEIGLDKLKGQTVFYGSSSIRFWKTLQEDFAPLTVINHGFGGSTFPELTNYVDRMVFAYQPKNLVIYCENDMFMGNPKTPEQNFDAFAEFVTLVQNRLPKTKIYYISMKPSPSRKTNWANVQKVDAMINDYVKKHKNFSFIDICPAMYRPNGNINGDFFLGDSLHMKPAGYAEWTKIVRPFLIK